MLVTQVFEACPVCLDSARFRGPPPSSSGLTRGSFFVAMAEPADGKQDPRVKPEDDAVGLACSGEQALSTASPAQAGVQWRASRWFLFKRTGSPPARGTRTRRVRFRDDKWCEEHARSGYAGSDRLHDVRAEGRAGFGLAVGASGFRGSDPGWGDLAEDVGAEGRGEPEVGFVAGAGGGVRRFDTAILFSRAAVFEPLTAILTQVHKRCSLDAHAGSTANAAPRSVYDYDLWGRVVNRAASPPRCRYGLSLSGDGM